MVTAACLEGTREEHGPTPPQCPNALLCVLGAAESLHRRGAVHVGTGTTPCEDLQALHC